MEGTQSLPDQTQAFPRIGVHLDTGQAVIGVPAPIQRATALLAAHLSRRADMPITAETMVSYAIGETSASSAPPRWTSFPAKFAS